MKGATIGNKKILAGREGHHNCSVVTDKVAPCLQYKWWTAQMINSPILLPSSSLLFSTGSQN